MASRRPSSPISTGQVWRLRQASAAGLAHSGGSSRDRNTPWSIPSRLWAATSECRRATLRSAAGSFQALAFSSCEAQPDQAVGPLQALGRQPDRAQDRPAAAHRPPGQPAGHGVDGLDPATPRALERRGQLAGQQPGQRDLDGHLLLGGLVPGDQLGAVDRQAGDLVEGPGLDVDRLDRLGLHVQEPDQHPDHGGVLGLEQALGLGRPGLVGAALAPQPGHQHPELPAGLVLGRRGPVGIQQVALVEDGVGHLAGQLEGREGRAHCLVSPASLNSASRASSQVGRARTALKRCSESSVSRRTRIQPPPGKKRSMISRHTATGSR